MAIASPTLQIAARAAFTEPSLYIAEFLFPRTPIPGAAYTPEQIKELGKNPAEWAKHKDAIIAQRLAQLRSGGK